MAETQAPEWQDGLSTNSAEDQDSDREETAREKGEKTVTEAVPDAEADEAADKEEETVKQEPAPDDLEDNSRTTESCQNSGDTILNTLSELNEKMDQMNLLFKQKIQHTLHEEKIVDQMHAELQKYKDDMYAQLLRPILLDIIEIRESIRRVSESFASKPEEERADLLRTFSDYTYDLQDVLEKNNITIYDSKEGDAFNALKHRAIKKDITPVEELHGKIAKSLSSGYEYIGKTISPEKVEVYIYQKSETTEGEN